MSSNQLAGKGNATGENGAVGVPIGERHDGERKTNGEPVQVRQSPKSNNGRGRVKVCPPYDMKQAEFVEISNEMEW